MNYNNYFPIVEYYKKVVVPINPDRYKVKSDKMFVCPVHNDHDPSLGLIPSKSGDTCHCFGCNFWGDVVELHQRVSRRLLKKYLSEDDAIHDLCKIFNVDYKSLPLDSNGGGLDKGLKQEVALNDAMGNFDIGDFKHLVYEGKRQKRPIGYFNALVMTMIDSCREE